MKLDGDVVPHPPSSPAKQTSLLIEERREPSDEAGLNGPRMASPACPSNKEREQEFSNKNEKGNIEKEKKKNKKGGKEERNKLKKIRKENKRQRRRKRKLEKEKAIAHTLLLLRMPETVPDAKQKKDDGSASSPAVSDVAVPNTEQKKDAGGVSEAAVSDTAVSEATMPDAGGSDGGFDDSDVSTLRFESWSSSEPEHDAGYDDYDDDEDLGQLTTPVPTPPSSPTIKKKSTAQYQDYFPLDSSSSSDNVKDLDTDTFAAKLFATQPLRVSGQAAAARPATAAGLSPAAPQGGNGNSGAATLDAKMAAITTGVNHLTEYREKCKVRSVEFDIVMALVREEIDRFAERLGLHDRDMQYLTRRVGSVEECTV